MRAGEDHEWKPSLGRGKEEKGGSQQGREESIWAGAPSSNSCTEGTGKIALRSSSQGGSTLQQANQRHEVEQDSLTGGVGPRPGQVQRGSSNTRTNE
jgi:hypothetical protein